MTDWTPEQIETVLWLDASDSDTITVDTGASVWTDKSLNEYDVSQATSTYQPTYDSDNKCLTFDGTQRMTAGSNYLTVASGEPGLIMFCVLAATDSGSSAFVVDEGNISTAGFGSNFSTDSQSSYTPVDDGGTVLSATESYDSGSMHIFEHRILLGDSHSIVVDGVVLGSDDITTTYLTSSNLDLSSPAASFTGPFTIGSQSKTYNQSSRGFTGNIYELLYISSDASDSLIEKIEGYLAWKWGIEANLPTDHPYYDAAPTLDLSTCSNGLEMVWTGPETYSAGLEMKWKAAISNGLRMLWPAAPTVKNGLRMVWRGGYVVKRGLLMKWGKSMVYRDGLKMVWPMLGVYRNGLLMKWPDVEGSVSNGLLMKWSVTDKEVCKNGLQMVWFGGGSSVDQVYVVGVTFGGEVIDPAEIRIRRSRSEYVIECQLAMAGDPDDLVGERLPRKYAYLTEAEQTAALAAAAVVVSIDVNGESETVELLATSISDTVSVDGCDYTIVAESAAVLLDHPYSLTVTDEYGSGMIGTLMTELVSGQPFSFSWDAVDWWIDGGVLYGNAEVPIDILRKPKEAIGGMIQSGLDGSLSVLPYYPVSKKDWATTDYDELLMVNENLWSVTRSDDEREDYNSFLVGDTLSSSASLTYDTVDVDYGIKQIRAYEVPWTGDNPGLDTSGPDRVVIQAGKIVTETISEEQVEIVDGEGKTQYPIYSMVDRDYGENTQLGSISYAEDGTITTEIAGQSIVLVSYQTKYWQWTVKDSVEEEVQFFSQPAWSDVAVALVVTFGDEEAADGFVVAEPDDTLNVDEDGETLSEIPPGSPFYFLLQHDDTIELDSVTVSAGSISELGEVCRDKSDRLEFPDSDSVELSYIPDGDVDVDWYGRTPSLSVDGRELSVSASPAIGEVEYSARMKSFSLTPPDMDLDEDENYYILINCKMVSV